MLLRSTHAPWTYFLKLWTPRWWGLQSDWWLTCHVYGQHCWRLQCNSHFPWISWNSFPCHGSLCTLFHDEPSIPHASRTWRHLVECDITLEKPGIPCQCLKSALGWLVKCLKSALGWLVKCLKSALKTPYLICCNHGD